MDTNAFQNTNWFPPLLAELRQELSELVHTLAEETPALQQELDALQEQIQGWKVSLGNRDLSEAVRKDIEEDYEKALARVHQIQAQLSENKNRWHYYETLLDPSPAAGRLTRLEKALAGENVTEMNVQLSLFIDKIECFPDRQVAVGTCRLGALPELAELLKKEVPEPEEEVLDSISPDVERATPRRRAKRRLDAFAEGDLKEDAHRGLNPARFVGLDNKWFWEDIFEIPQKVSWIKEHGEEVFQLRQREKLSYAKIAKRFGVSTPTARAAVLRYLAEHPEEEDKVDLPRGGKRPPKFDLAKFGMEARKLWEEGWSKLKLAEKYGCSSPTIDKALAWAYAQDGLPVPAQEDRKKLKIAKARNMLDDGWSLEEIAAKLKVSDTAARQYLKESFKAEGKLMPDLRSRRKHR